MPTVEVYTIDWSFNSCTTMDLWWINRDKVRGGQGAYGWRHFKQFIPDVEILKLPIRVFEKIVKPIFQMRSHPRWSARKWRAKT